MEFDESFQVQIVAANPGVLVTTAAAAGQILNDDGASVSVSAAAQAEGGILHFAVTLDADVPESFTIPWATADGTATVAGNDYVPANGHLVFQGLAGETHTISVTTVRDLLVERHETLQLTLGTLAEIAPSLAARMTVQSGTGTITNDDRTTLIAKPLRWRERDSGTTLVDVDLQLWPHAVDTAFTVLAATQDETAQAGRDFDGLSTTVSFSGAAGQTQTLALAIHGDLAAEGNETLAISLSGLQAGGREAFLSLVDGQVTILDDDQPGVMVSDVRQAETNTGTVMYAFEVRLLNPTGGPISVDVATQAGTAQAGTDFVAKSQTLSFAGNSGETRTFTVQVHADQLVELTESFSVVLSNLQAGGNEAAYALVSGIGTVENDDTASLEVEFLGGPCPGDTSVLCVSEGDGGANFRVTLTQAVDVPLIVTASTSPGGQTHELNFAGTIGETKVVSVPVEDDDVVEPDWSVSAFLTDVEASGRHVVIGAAALKKWGRVWGVQFV